MINEATTIYQGMQQREGKNSQQPAAVVKLETMTAG